MIRILVASLYISIIPLLIGCRDNGNLESKLFVEAGDLKISPAEIFHKVAAGTKEVEFIYTATNNGTKPIEITNIDSGCTCIEEVVEPKIIPPGGSATIKATYITGRLLGLAEHSLAIETNQPGIAEALLKVKLEVDPIYLLDKNLTSWRKGAAPKTKSIVFEVIQEKPIHILELIVSRPEISAEVETITKGRRYIIHITPKSTQQNMLGLVTLVTDCEIKAHAKPLLFVKIK